MHRNITFRLIPGTRAKATKLSQTAGACRWVWNRILSENRRQYREFRDAQTFCEDSLLGLLFECPAKPSTSFFSLGKQFSQLRAQTPWLKALPFTPVRYVLKYQSEAWQRAFSDRKAGLPKFKARRGEDSLTIPQDVRIRTDSRTGVHRLWVPKIGWMVLRRRGGNPYNSCPPVQAVIKRVLGRWYCTICYDVGEREVADNGLAVGLDRNCGHVAFHDGSFGRIMHMPDVARLEARGRRYQRMMARRKNSSKRRALARYRCAKNSRKLAMIRANWHHHVSRVLADGYGTVVVEALDTRAMTTSAKGTANKPGTGVKAKAALNRRILETGWAGLKKKLHYKAANLIEVAPSHTSQCCSACGHTDAVNRKSQSKFLCARCGFEGNADINAALNILARGTGASGRRGAWALAPPKTRQRDMLASVAALPT